MTVGGSSQRRNSNVLKDSENLLKYSASFEYLIVMFSGNKGRQFDTITSPKVGLQQICDLS